MSLVPRPEVLSDCPAADDSARLRPDSLRSRPWPAGEQEERDMSYAVDFVNVATVGLESSPVADALAGLRANEARYFKNKYNHGFTVQPAAKAKKAINLVHRILKEERDIVIESPPLEATTFQVENIRWT